MSSDTCIELYKIRDCIFHGEDFKSSLTEHLKLNFEDENYVIEEYYNMWEKLKNSIL